MTNRLKELFDKDIFARELGIVIVEVEDGNAEAKLTIKDNMMNGAGVANGAAVFALVDFTLAVAANSANDGVSLTMNVNINYCKPAVLGDVITAKAACIARSGKSVSCNIIATNQDEEVVAVAHGSAYKTTKLQMG